MNNLPARFLFKPITLAAPRWNPETFLTNRQNQQRIQTSRNWLKKNDIFTTNIDLHKSITQQ